MDKMEKAEKVVEKTGVTYEEAREALEATDYDVLDAIVWLERRGKARPQSASYSTSSENRYDTSIEMSHAQSDYEKATRENGFAKALDRFFKWLGAVLKKSVQITLVVSRKGERLFSIPLLLFIILLIVAFWVVVPLMIVGLFFDIKYSFEGIKPITVDLNDLSEKASKGAETLKNDVTNGAQSVDSEHNGNGSTTSGTPSNSGNPMA
jgi:hypothetical protein